MRLVNSGEGRIPLISLIAMLSISLTVNLPGLAISPIVGKLDTLFPHDSHLEFQMLTVLPNFIIIPFILWSGHLCTRFSRSAVLATGLVVYAISAVIYLFTQSMTGLILLGCLLGAGCGLVVPIATGIIGEYFSGREKVCKLGVASGISNFVVIIGTIFVGWIAAIDWHLAFLIYLVPIIPIALMPFMTKDFLARHSVVTKTQTSEAANIQERIESSDQTCGLTRETVLLLAGIIGLYVLTTYSVEVVSYFTPFAMQHYSLTTDDVGVVTAMFFLASSLSGFLLNPILKLLKDQANFWAIICCIAGLYLAAVWHSYFGYMVGTFIMGWGYGIIQPIIYDKTTRLAPTKEKSTLYFSYVLTANYVAIGIVPFVVEFIADITESHSVNFPFWLNGTVMVGTLIWAIAKRRSFIFVK